MMNPKTAKTLTVILCTLLVLLLVFTMFAGAFAASANLEVDDRDSGIDVYVESEDLVESHRDVKIKVVAEFLAGDDFTNTVTEMEQYDRFDGSAVLAVASAFMFGSDDEMLSSAVLSSAELWLPLTEEQAANRNLSVVAINMFLYMNGYADPFEAPLCYQRTRDGQKYLVFEGDLNTYYIVTCDADDSGAPIKLMWYEQGVVGWIWRLRGAAAMLLIAIGLFLGFYVKWTPQKKTVESEPEALPEAATENAENEESEEKQ